MLACQAPRLSQGSSLPHRTGAEACQLAGAALCQEVQGAQKKSVVMSVLDGLCKKISCTANHSQSRLWTTWALRTLQKQPCWAAIGCNSAPSKPRSAGSAFAAWELQSYG